MVPLLCAAVSDWPFLTCVRFQVVEQLEGKQSLLKEEVVQLKEQLSRALLDKEVTEQEMSHVSEVLSKSELQKAELELDVNKMRSEEVALRDALVKLQSLNEGLGQDKIELNKIIKNMEADKSSLSNEKRELEVEKNSIRQELIRVEQEKVRRTKGTFSQPF